MPVVIFIVLGVIIFVIVILSFIGHVLELRRDALRQQRKGFSCEYRVSGGIEDEYHAMTLQYLSDEQASFREETRTDHGRNSETAEKTVPVEILDQLIAFFDDHDIASWGELPPVEEQALDAPATTVTFHVGEKEYTIHSDQKLPQSDSIAQIRKIFSACETQD